MSIRRHSREMTLQLLFQREFLPAKGPDQSLSGGLEREPKGLLQDFIVNFEMEREVSDYAGRLFRGVCENLEPIDHLIEAHARHWKIARMSLVDLSILRMAVFEMSFLEPRIDSAVAINEAVDLAKEFGSTDSASFVNGILDPIARRL